jgi:hypothetical protein
VSAAKKAAVGNNERRGAVNKSAVGKIVSTFAIAAVVPVSVGVLASCRAFEEIFDAFERIDAAPCEGLGIGLFVVPQAVEQLGPHIEIRSVPSHCSGFSVFALRAG